MTASWHVVAKLLTASRMTKVDYRNSVTKDWYYTEILQSLLIVILKRILAIILGSVCIRQIIQIKEILSKVSVNANRFDVYLVWNKFIWNTLWHSILYFIS